MSEGFALRRELQDEKLKEQRLARIEELENQVYEQAAQIARAVLDFSQVTPGQKDPPPEWVADYGEEAARQRLAVALSGWLPSSIAPNAVTHAIKMMVGISRGRQHRYRVTQNNNLNVRLVLPTPTSREHPGPIVYPTKDLDE